VRNNKKQQTIQQVPQQPPFLFEELEPRLLLSADLPGVFADGVFLDDDDAVAFVPDAFEVVDAQMQETAGDPASAVRHELVFIDVDTPDYQQLLDDLRANRDDSTQFEIILLENDHDGITQISEALNNANDLDAIHLISHGADGSIDLGNSVLDVETLDANAQFIEAWGNALTAGGDLLIYGCNLAATQEGQTLVDSLGSLTGADVAASDDLTGNATLGGDWELEYRTGAIETDVAVSAALQANWSATLATETVRDNFDTVSYSNNDGSVNWVGNWNDTEDGLPSTDSLLIQSGTFLVKHENGIQTNYVERQVDLSGASSATITWDYNSQLMGSSGVTLVQYAINGNWGAATTLDTYSNTQNLNSGSASFALPTGNADTRIRIYVQSADSENDTVSFDNLQIQYTNNNAPTDIALSNSSVNENVDTSGGYSVGTLTTTDPNGGDSHGYSIVGGANAGLFSIGGAGSDELFLDDSVLDFETQSSYQVTVRTTDNGTPNLFYDETLTITVNNQAGNISGTAFSDEGSTNLGAGTSISLLINGVNVETAVTDASGAYSFNTEAGAGDAAALFIDNDATYQGNTVTVADGADLGAIDLYADHVIVRHDNGGLLTIADMDTALGGYTDSDILYSVSAGDLTANIVNSEIFVPFGHTFAPGGNIAADSVEIQGTFSGSVHNYDLAANWDASTGTFNANNSTLSFVSRLSGFGFDAGASSYYNVSIDANDTFFNLGSNLTVSNDLTLLSSGGGIGTLTMGSLSVDTNNFIWQSGYLSHLAGANMVVSGDFINTGGSFFTGDGSGLTITFDGNTDSTFTAGSDVLGNVVVNKGSQANSVTLSTDDLNLAAASTLDISSGILDIAGNNLDLGAGSSFSNTGTLRLQGGELVSNLSNDSDSGTVVYNGGGSYAGLAAGDAYYNLVLDNGAGSWTLGNALDVDADLSITNGTLDVSAGNHQINVAGDWNNSGSFLARNGTVVFDGGNQTINGSTTFNNLTKIDASNDATDVTLAFDNTATQTINGTLTLDGLDTDDRINLVSDSAGNQWSINLAATASKAIDFVDVTDSDATGSDPIQLAIEPVNAVDGGNNDGWFNIAPMATNLSTGESYIEDIPLNLTDIVITDPDSINVTVTLTLSDPAAGALSTATSGSVTSTYNAVAGVWTASGTLADVNLLLAGVMFTPSSNYNSNFTIATSVSDGIAAPLTGVKNMTATAVNDVPVAIANTVSTVEDTTYSFNLSDFTFSDADGDALVSVTINNQSLTGGTLQLSGVTVNNGDTILAVDIANLVYTPANEASGAPLASFDFTVNDASAGVVAAQMTIDVTAVNDAPLITSDGGGATAGVSVMENNTAVTVVTATDVEGGPLTYFISGGADAALFTIDSSSGALRFNSAPDFELAVDADANNVYQVEVSVDDGSGANAAQLIDVTITDSNDTAPVIGSGQTFNIAEDALDGTSLGGATASDADSPGSLQNWQIVSGNSAGIFQINPSTGELTVADSSQLDYESNSSYNLGVQVSDGVSTSTVELITLDVLNINEAPSNVVPADTQNTPENTPLVFSNVDGNAISIIEADGSGAIVEVTLSVSNGTLSLSGTGGLTFSVGSGNGDTLMTLTGQVADINAALDGLVFQPDAEYQGFANLSFITDDLGGGGGGTVLNAVATLNISVVESASTNNLTTLDELFEEFYGDPQPPELISAAAESSEPAQSATGSSSTEFGLLLTEMLFGGRSGSASPAEIDVAVSQYDDRLDFSDQDGDRDRQASSVLIQQGVRQALTEPFLSVNTLLPVQPGAPIWNVIDIMMGQMSSDNGSPLAEDQVLTIGSKGLTFTLTAGYVSWLLRAGSLSASLMSIAPLWREFDPLPILSKPEKKKRRVDATSKDRVAKDESMEERVFTT
jgi:hypothetical protein